MKIWRLATAVLVMALVGGAAVFGLPDLSPKLDEIPTTRPVHGNIDVRVHAIGELGPRRSMVLAAPTVGATAPDHSAIVRRAPWCEKAMS